jgi:hypothetical protein
MDKFVERQNVAKFTSLLMKETDPSKRELLQKLLAEEQKLLAEEIVKHASLSHQDKT